MRPIQELKDRIRESPNYIEWTQPKEWGGMRDSIICNGSIDYIGLTDEEKMFVFIYAWNTSNLCPNKKCVMTEFGWNAYKVYKLFKGLKQYGMECVSTFSATTGLLCGRGYNINIV